MLTHLGELIRDIMNCHVALIFVVMRHLQAGEVAGVQAEHEEGLEIVRGRGHRSCAATGRQPAVGVLYLLDQTSDLRRAACHVAAEQRGPWQEIADRVSRALAVAAFEHDLEPTAKSASGNHASAPLTH